MLEKLEADVIIIGGGIMGCATAYRLAKRGVDVLVLEKKEIGNGGSCRNAGGVRQSARDPKELPLAMYAVQNIWPQLSEELGVDVEYHQGGQPYWSWTSWTAAWPSSKTPRAPSWGWKWK